MKTVPGLLRGKGRKGSPFLATSATATPLEIEELKQEMGLRNSNTVVLKADPIQNQFMFVRVKRPANIHGSFGSENSAGELQPGLIDTLNKLYMDRYVHDMKNGVPVKKAIWFFRNENDIADVYDELCDRY